jgi:DNA-binding GntR family transcriptional regulator
MNGNHPLLRSEAFNEAFDAFEDAFLKALTTPNPFVFEMHDTVLRALRGMCDEGAVAKLREAELSLLQHASGEKPLYSSEAERLIVALNLRDAEAVQNAVRRHGLSLTRHAHHAF